MNIDTFLQLAVASGLLNDRDINKMRGALFENENWSGPPCDCDRLSAAISYFIQNDCLTAWQCEKLAEGRFKGFFLGKYKLLSYNGPTDISTKYMAQNTVSNETVEIQVTPEVSGIRLVVISGGRVIDNAFVGRGGELNGRY